jgi:hypothetical protein
MFDARKYRESLEKPTYVDTDENGREVRFEGELVPFNTVLDILDSLSNLEGKTETQVNDLITESVKRIKMSDEVLPFLLTLPLAGRLEAVLSFFQCLHGVKKQ